jgi:hypothetical protein
VRFREPSTVTRWFDIDLTVDVDEFSDPSGIEVIGFSEALGRAAAGLAQVTAGSSVRFGYDEEADAAAIGVDIAGGSSVRSSIPRRGRAGLDANGRLCVLELQMPTASA